jgi:multiple sugar transport system permease protein
MKPSCFKSFSSFVLRFLVAIFFLLPVAWFIGAALHPPGLPLPTTLKILPIPSTFENFYRLYEYFPLARLGFNSLWISLAGVFITLMTASLFALGITLLPKRSGQHWIILLLAVMMVPEFALWLPRFFLYKTLGLIDSPMALIAPALIGTNPFFILMYYRAFRCIPRQIYEVAQIDGAGILQLWLFIALPIAFPTTLGVGLLSFVLYWGDFTSPMLYLNSDRFITLPLALQTLQQLSRSDWSLLMAGVVTVTSIPVLLFILLMPYFNRHVGK